jgi:hypothetical protein
MDFTATLKSKYSYLSDTDVDRIVNQAKMFYYMLKYPNDIYANEESRPILSFSEQEWIIRCSEDLIERLGFSSSTAYKENGISWNFDNAHISASLVKLIVPLVGVIE